MKNTETVVGKIDPDVLAFTAGKDPVLDLNLVEWDCIGSAAHVTMLSKMNVKPVIFTKKDRDSVIHELGEIVKDARLGKFVITEADQDTHLAVERRLTEKLGDIGKRIHTGRSRNDQVATDLRLYGRDQLLKSIGEALDLSESLLKFARKHEKLPMVGRTHLQPAMPSTVGLWAAGYAEALLDDLLPLWAAFDYTNNCPLGSAAGYGVPLPLDRELTSRLMAFAAPVHSVTCVGIERGKCEYTAITALSNLMLTVSRLAEDLIIFSMPEFAYFSIPKEFCTGSSIMPQKYNPDVCELIRAKAARVAGNASSAASMLKGMPGGYNRDLQDTKELFIDCFDTTRATLRIMTRLVGGLKADSKKLRSAFAPGVFATDKALELVAGGMPFRDAYHSVRDNLDDLAMMDPDAAVAAKTHLGATAGLDFEQYALRVGGMRQCLKSESAAIASAVRKLIGV